MKFKAMSDGNRKLQVNWARVEIYVTRYKPNTSFVLEITRRQAKVSDPMRRYYFAEVMPKLTEGLGYEKDEVLLLHHLLKARYFRSDPKHGVYQDERGMWRNVPAVFAKESDLDVSVKKEFVDWVVRTGAKHGVMIDDPNGGWYARRIKTD